MSTTSPDPPDERSRLDREIDEILERNDNIRLLPPPPTPKRQRPSPSQSLSSATSTLPAPLQRALRVPLVQAFLLVIVAIMIDGVSPLLANVLCAAAVLCIIVPIVTQWRRPGAMPESRTWRGREIDPPSRFASPESPIDRARRWWSSRQ